MPNLATQLQEGILKEFRDNPYPGDTIALDIASYIEPEKVNECLIDLTTALAQLNANGAAYYIVGTIEIVMEVG